MFLKIGLFLTSSKYSFFFIVSSPNKALTILGERDTSMSNPLKIDIVLLVIVMSIGTDIIVLNSSVTAEYLSIPEGGFHAHINHRNTSG
jgi:hypothetical protein